MHKQKGFSLLEVLITLVIISFGLLGIAGVIVNSLKNNQSSYSRSQATWLANDIIERMRANRSTAELSPSPYGLAMTETAPIDTSIPSTDLTEWRESLVNTMPSGGTGSVSMDGNKKVTVIVQWNDSRASGDKVDVDERVTIGLKNQQITIETRL